MTAVATDRPVRTGEPGPAARVGRGPLTGFLLAGSAAAALSFHVARGEALLAARWSLLAALGLWAVVWLVAVGAAFRLPVRVGVPLVFAAAVLVRLGAVAGPALTSDDLFRYSWDGRVQAAGIDPYEYTPGSTHLTELREPWLWPEQRPCPLAYREQACTRINRASAHTIYPPAAEAWFAVVYRLTGIGARYKPWQIAGLLTDVIVVALLITALRRRGRDPRWAALYGLCPAPVLEIVNNGHVDGLAILLSLAAVTVAAPPVDGRRRLTGGQRDVAAGVLVGLAVLVKLFPALLVLAIAAGAPGRRSRTLVRTGGTALAVCIAGYLPHVAAVGGKVIGFLPGYLREEHYAGAGRYLVAGALHVPGGLAGPLSVLVLAGAAAWVWVRRPPAPLGAAVLMGTLLAVASPVQPWYAVSLLAFATLAVSPQWAAIVAAGYPYFFAVILISPHQTGIGQLSYAAAVAVVALATRSDAVRQLRKVGHHEIRGCSEAFRGGA